VPSSRLRRGFFDSKLTESHVRKASEPRSSQHESQTLLSESTFVNYTSTNPDTESTVIDQPSTTTAKSSDSGKKVLAKKKKTGKPVMSAKEKRERGVRL
jgi:hypothetical protein